MPIRQPGDAARVHLPHPEIFEGVKAGHTLLLDDGKIRLTVTDASKQKIARASRSAASFPTARASACPTPSCRSRR